MRQQIRFLFFFKYLSYAASTHTDNITTDNFHRFYHKLIMWSRITAFREFHIMIPKQIVNCFCLMLPLWLYTWIKFDIHIKRWIDIVHLRNDIITRFDLIWFFHVQQYFSYIMATSFSGGRSRSIRKEPPTMGKQRANFITCGCESSAPFL